MAKDTAPEAKIAQLTEMQRYVTQQRGTEPPYSGALLHNKQEGIYHCLICEAPLFSLRRSMTLAVAGPVSTSRSVMMRFAILKMIHTACSVLRSAVAVAMRTWDMSSLTARSRPANAIVLTPPR